MSDYNNVMESYMYESFFYFLFCVKHILIYKYDKFSYL